MSRAVRRLAVIFALSAAVAACSTTKQAPTAPPRSAAVAQPAEPEPAPNPIYKVGMPYEVAGVWYYPQEQPNYDETGIASWYGTEFHGRLTANGEVFDRTAISGAHPTLPMPVNVRVTNLENGRSIVVRVNDRGPYVNGRIIDLSERTADLLGYRVQGTARVRVTFLGRADLHGLGPAPPAQDTPSEVARAVPAAPTRVIETAALPPVTGAATTPLRPVAQLPKPVAQPVLALRADIPDGRVIEVPVPPTTAIYVQAGAFTSPANATMVATKLYGLGARVMRAMKDGHPIYRVRIGPLQDVGTADEILGRVQGLGHNDAQIVVDSVTG